MRVDGRRHRVRARFPGENPGSSGEDPVSAEDPGRPGRTFAAADDVDVPGDTGYLPPHQDRDQADPVGQRCWRRAGQRPDRRQSRSSPGFRHLDHHRHGRRPGIGDAAGGGARRGCRLFGVGVGLTVDEFALWLHLEDVYWTDAGRKSVDAIFCVLVITGALIGGADFVTGRVGTAGWWSSVAVITVNLLLCVICLLKGKVVTGVTGISSASWLLSAPSGWPGPGHGGQRTATPPAAARQTRRKSLRPPSRGTLEPVARSRRRRPLPGKARLTASTACMRRARRPRPETRQ